MNIIDKKGIRDSIRTIADFPKPGVMFRDITPLLLNEKKFRACIDALAKKTKRKIDYVVSIESRGFILGSALAYALGAGFVPIRKAGKLPYEKFQTAYDLEYGQAVIEIHKDALKKNCRVLIVDDVLATGGTAEAATKLMKNFGCKVAALYFLIELRGLKGRSKLKGFCVDSLIAYD